MVNSSMEVELFEEKEAMCRKCGHEHMVAVIYDEDGEIAAIEITRCGDCGAVNPVKEDDGSVETES